MKGFIRFLCLAAALLMLTCGASLAEVLLYDPVAVVRCDQAALADWTPNYGLNPPGVLLELTHSEGMLSVTALKKGEQTPETYLSGRLDLAAETLAVSDAQLLPWSDPFKGDGRQLTFSYTYPDGDETHLFSVWTASYKDMLIELSADVWGEESSLLMENIRAAFIENGFTVGWYENASQLTAVLSDVVESETGSALVQLTAPAGPAPAPYYPLSPDAVVLFPNPDNPSLFYPVAPDMTSLVDAILTYEESSDSPAAFRSIIHGGSIVYMEYSLTQQ